MIAIIWSLEDTRVHQLINSKLEFGKVSQPTLKSRFVTRRLN